MRLSGRATIAAVATAVFWVVAAGVQSRTGLAQQPNKSSLKGVWRFTEETSTGPNARTLASQPGFLIFTDRYYSVNRVLGNAPRPDMPAPPSTDKAFADATRNFWSWAGTYSVTGNEVTMDWLVTLSPNAMKTGKSTFTYKYRLDGDTMWLTQARETRDGVKEPNDRPSPLSYE